MNQFTKSILLATVPLMFLSCRGTSDREAKINPKIEDKLITVSNLSDYTRDGSTSYFKPNSLASATDKSSAAVIKSSEENRKSTEITSDVLKITKLIKSEDRSKFLNSHLVSGGEIALVMHEKAVRIYAVGEKNYLEKNISSSIPKLALADLLKAKSNRIANNQITAQTRTVEPTSKTRFIEIAVVEIEKSGVLESEKTDYNETKPLLNIVMSLPLEVSTHLILKSESSDLMDGTNKAEKLTLPTEQAATK